MTQVISSFYSYCNGRMRKGATKENTGQEPVFDAGKNSPLDCFCDAGFAESSQPSLVMQEIKNNVLLEKENIVVHNAEVRQMCIKVGQRIKSKNIVRLK